MEQTVFGKRGWVLVPGLVVLVFTLASLALPVGQGERGASFRRDPGMVGALARWAAELHDGYWHRNARPGLSMTPGLNERGRSAGIELCRRGLAEEALAYYHQHRYLSLADREALFELLNYLIVNGEYDRAERYAREGDMLLHGGVLRNNLAWHYTQTRLRPTTALALALSSVAADRNICAVDTLAWAYWRCNMTSDAVRTANQTLAFNSPWGSSLMRYEEDRAKASSRKLLGLMGRTAAPATSRR